MVGKGGKQMVSIQSCRNGKSRCHENTVEESLTSKEGPVRCQPQGGFLKKNLIVKAWITVDVALLCHILFNLHHNLWDGKFTGENREAK